MLILTTGVSGCGEKEYLKTFVEFARKKGKKALVYAIGEMMFSHAHDVGLNITRENILNANPNTLNSLRGAVLEKILANLENDLKENDVVIIIMHAVFFWKKIFLRAYEKFYLDKLNPDMFITFIDRSEDIEERLSEKDQWKQEMPSEDEILLWQNVEVEMTATFAEFWKKQFFVYPIKQPIDTLYKLLFHPKMEPIYVSMPITHINSKGDFKKIDLFVEKLNKYFTVFDPRTIEIPTDVEIDKTVYYQTINRDLYWLVRQSKKVIAYFPTIVASTGVINELREGYETNKDVWLIFPSQKKSPFTLYFTTKIFESEQEFFTFLKKYIKDKYGVAVG
ncbi:AAA family ATPase [Candidatus Pacearchaeota archaeon]|nr:AAA family ATPase [Candidatus Pacearchaeota archaeon]